MPVPMTLRVDQSLKEQLSKLGELRHMTMNKLAIQALQQFVAKETLLVEEELEASLRDLRKYREADPDFEKAIEAAAEAELSTDQDPAQGVIEAQEGFETTRLLRGLLSA
ncbi:hypothetical protein [Pseudoruegeria sp. HB172150]|uniref:hypothetical protein n=1 Tax=Pseudoruegeria sp. HB172150 TaxID=2721164 RepID=UPI001554A328|nr:hypothetical protein [Pseudoruegeria sp. HB172150]